MGRKEGGINSIVLEGRLTPDHKTRSDYRLLPFEVPTGTCRIEVRYTYNRDADNVLDLGLFDPRGTDFLCAKGFRGWSGGARDHVVITERSATPGYLPGPIFPGIWHVLLGLYQISSSGCSYRIEILLSQKEGDPPQPPPPAKELNLMTRPGPAWFKGDLHAHTHHSDAHCSVAELAAAARCQGLDFLAVTDHNTVSHHAYLTAHSGPELLLIPGQEVTTYRGHANVWGRGSWLDFRCRSREEMARIIGEAHRQGLLFSINHPKPKGPEWLFGSELPFDCVEVWQGLWCWNNEHSLAFWERLLRQGRRVVAVGGSDTHPFPLSDGRLLHWLGCPTTWVYAKALTLDAVLAGIRAGHVTITAWPTAARAVLSIRGRDAAALQGDVVDMEECTVEVHVVGGEGFWLRLLTRYGEIAREHISSPDWKYEQKLNLAVHGYVRAEVRMPGQDATPLERLPMVTMTNPVWHAAFLNSRIKEGI